MDNRLLGELSRRRMLGLVGAGGAAMAAAACTDTSDSPEPGSDTPKVESDFNIPDPAGEIPAGDIRWVDSGDMKAKFFEAFFPEYEKARPGVKVDYQGSNWNAITEVISTGLRNGTAPDVFQLPSQITMGQAVSEGWIGAYDDIVPDFAEIKKRFPPWSFSPGANEFSGKTYGMPITGQGRLGTLMLFNADYTQNLDVDLANEVIDWKQLREILKQLTEEGEGNYFGTLFSLAQPNGTPVGPFAQMAGMHGGPDQIDLTTGEWNCTNPLLLESIELILQLKSDGSVHPDSPNMDAPDARGRMPQGQAAMMFQGPWNIPLWREENPEFNLDLNLPPQRDPNDIWKMTYGPGGSNQWVYHAKSKHTAIIGDIMSYVCSEDGQIQFGLHDGAADPPSLPEAVKQLKLDELQQKALELGNQWTLIAPDPAAANPDVTMVLEEQEQPTPNFSDTIVGLYTGEDKDDVETAMHKLADRQEQSLEDAIKVAKQRRGAKVDRDDWVFADWDPRKPYTKLYTE